MNYKYTAIYQVLGIQRTQSSEKQVIYKTPTAESYLFEDIDSVFIDFNKWDALRAVLLSGAKGNTIQERFAHKLASVKSERAKKYRDAVFLVFQATGTDSLEVPTEIVDVGGIGFTVLESPIEKPVGKQYREAIHGLISAMALAIDTVCKIDEVGTVTAYNDNEANPLFLVSLGMSGFEHASRPSNAEDISFIMANSKKLADKEYTKISRLLVQSMDKKNDSLLLFLSAWNALEVFINKTFKELKPIAKEIVESESCIEKLDKQLISTFGSHSFEKFSPKEKMIIICCKLPSCGTAEVEKFMEIKKVRDDFTHGDDIDLNNLPTIETQTLLRYLLRLKIETISD